MTKPAWSFVGLGIALAALTIPQTLLHHAGEVEIGTRDRMLEFVAFGVVAALCYFAAVALTLMASLPSWALPVILAFAALMRILPLVTPPSLSSDVYRYVWDGRVQAHGINPYLYIPSAPELMELRDEAVYSKMNRADSAPTIYPPVAQLIFAATGQVLPSVFGIKLVMVLFEALGIGVMLRLLRLAGLPQSRVLIYAWNPLAVWEYAGNGHIDAANIGFVALALLAVAARRQALVGVALTAAILCKFLPVVLFPAFWRRWDWQIVVGAAGTVVAGYAIYIGAGSHVLGYLFGYTNEEGLGTGDGIFAARLVSQFIPVSGKLVLGIVVTGLAALAAGLAFGKPLPDAPGARTLAVAHGSVMLVAAVIAGISPHYPWYLGWLAFLSCLVPYPSIIYLSGSGVLLYLDPGHDEILWPTLVYGGFLLLAAADFFRAYRFQAPRAAL